MKNQKEALFSGKYKIVKIIIFFTALAYVAYTLIDNTIGSDKVNVDLKMTVNYDGENIYLLQNQFDVVSISKMVFLDNKDRQFNFKLKKKIKVYRGQEKRLKIEAYLFDVTTSPAKPQKYSFPEDTLRKIRITAPYSYDDKEKTRDTFCNDFVQELSLIDFNEGL